MVTVKLHANIIQLMCELKGNIISGAFFLIFSTSFILLALFLKHVYEYITYIKPWHSNTKLQVLFFFSRIILG